LALVPAAARCQHPVGVAARAPATVFCTQIACDNQLVVELRREDGRPPALAVTVTHDGKSASCLAPGPQDVRLCGEEVTSTIVGGDRAQQVVEIRGTPRTVEIELRDGARLVGRKRFTPQYQQRQPNGPGCPPLCHQATESWQL
jgi:hypothetical protein